MKQELKHDNDGSGQGILLTDTEVKTHNWQKGIVCLLTVLKVLREDYCGWEKSTDLVHLSVPYWRGKYNAGFWIKHQWCKCNPTPGTKVWKSRAAADSEWLEESSNSAHLVQCYILISPLLPSFSFRLSILISLSPLPLSPFQLLSPSHLNSL